MKKFGNINIHAQYFVICTYAYAYARPFECIPAQSALGYTDQLPAHHAKLAFVLRHTRKDFN